jgi:hypothetical protein
VGVQGQHSALNLCNRVMYVPLIWFLNFMLAACCACEGNGLVAWHANDGSFAMAVSGW